MKSEFLFQAAAYARVSKDDNENNSIENQIELIKEFVKSMPEINIISERMDNGFSGVNFMRPSFIEMMQDIEAGKINCVIVKDLSRLGRNYIEVGELIENIFPRLHVRLIAINDHYDSNKPKTDSDEILIPFKNLINEQYLRDFSIKIRSNLEVKRKKGDFVGAFAPYGYIRDINNKKRMIIDEHASKIVQDIFRWKIEGKSQQIIADYLNNIGEPSPSEYKQITGINYFAPFKTHTRALWSTVAVSRILKNPVYIGTLAQGKATTPNYKVKKRIIKQENEWNIKENAHEPIINKIDYEIVKSLLRQDTRIAPNNETVFPLAGFMYCGDCGNSIIRKKVRKYGYYVCATNKTGKGCSSHSFNQIDFENFILEVIKKQINSVLNIEKCLNYLQSLSNQQKYLNKINKQISDREKETTNSEKYKRLLYEDYKNGDISKEDYISFNSDYNEKIKEMQEAIIKLRQEIEFLSDNIQVNNIVDDFKRFRNVKELSRQLVTNLIEKIDMYENKRVVIKFRYENIFEEIKKEIFKPFTINSKMENI